MKKILAMILAATMLFALALLSVSCAAAPVECYGCEEEFEDKDDLELVEIDKKKVPLCEDCRKEKECDACGEEFYSFEMEVIELFGVKAHFCPDCFEDYDNLLG